MMDNGVPEGESLRGPSVPSWKTTWMDMSLDKQCCGELARRREDINKISHLPATGARCYNVKHCESGSVPGSTHSGNVGSYRR